MLTVINEAEKHILPSGQKIRIIICQCDCGKKKNVALLHLVRKRIVSCGCKFKTKNSLSGTRIYRVWKAINERCDGKYDKTSIYVKKNISVCNEWKNSFDSFYNWAVINKYEKGLQIDRIDNNWNYSPENCRVVVPKINTSNRDTTIFVVYGGIKIAFTILMDNLGRSKDISSVRARINRGWNAQKAIDTPIRTGNYVRKDKK